MKIEGRINIALFKKNIVCNNALLYEKNAFTLLFVVMKHVVCALLVTRKVYVNGLFVGRDMERNRKLGL
jgi:hypothetical protein